MRKSICIAASCATVALIASSAMAQLATRKDYNGELVNGVLIGNGDIPPTGSNPTNTVNDHTKDPYGWSYYTSDLGGNTGNETGYGNTSSAILLRGEDESGIPNPPGTATYFNPGGHSFLFGGSNGATAGQVATYGLQQNIVSTAGKHYWMVGSFRATGNYSLGYGMSYGLNNGSSTAGNGGLLARGNTAGGGNGYNSSANLGGDSFLHGMVATGSTITAHMGFRQDGSIETAAKGNNTYVDGIRVWERSIPVYAGLQNGNIEGSTQNASNWKTALPADLNGQTGNNWREDTMFDGWLPMGGAAGKLVQVKQGTNGAGNQFDGANPPVNNIHPGSVHSLFVDEYQAQGRFYFMQHVKVATDPSVYPNGVGLPYTFSADAFAFTPTGSAVNTATPMIGIDPTGGNDPLSASIIWSSAAVANNIWQALSITAAATGTNGVTLWMAGGNNGQDAANPNRNAGTAGFAFDEGTLAVPEPTTIAFLVLGGLLVARRRSAK